MTESIVVNPTTVDEIEFYVSNDGTYTGMSQTGLAKLCGVGESTVRGLLNKLGSQQNPPESLKTITGKESWVRTSAPNNAQIVPSHICAEIIYYYAFESKVANDNAKYSFKKFATIGIDNWIKQITGYVESDSNKEVLSCLHQLIGDVAELKETSKAYHTLKGTTTKVFPGLNKMLDELEVEDEFLELEPDIKEMTATEWLKSKGITFDTPQKRRFALLLSETYKTTVGKDAKKVNRKSKDGKKNNGVSVYHWTEFPILQLCLNKLLFEDNIG
jgi:hypothetical protein